MIQEGYLKTILFISLLASIAIPAYTGLYIYPQSRDLIIKQVEHEATLLAKHLSTTLFKDVKSLQNEILPEEFIQEVEVVLHDFELYKIKTFSSSGRVIYSSDADDIGELNQRTYFQDIVTKGNIYGKIVNKQERSLEDEVVNRDVYEIYVPIMKDNTFNGAFEVYYDVTKGMQQIRSLKWRNYAISGVCSLTLLLIILFSFYNLSRSLEQVQFESRERERAEKEKRIMENKLMRAQKMEAIGLMAGGVAHDLNNILSGIVSYPSLLLEKVPKGSTSYQTIKIIQESGQRAAAVVADLLTIARGVASSRTVTNLNEIVANYLSSIEFEKLISRFPDIEVKQQLDPALMFINCSPIHINKVVMNLVTNAIEAIDTDGTMRITTANRYLDTPMKGYETIREGDYVVLAISDDGPGISDSDLDRIFEPFYSSKKMGRSGTGLGLTVVWNSVHDHHGYINITSGDQGTVFTLYFPALKDKPSKQEAKKPLAKFQGNGEKILVVDDESHQRIIVESLLQHLGYTVATVSSGEGAITYLQNNTADLVVLDMVMHPGMNGRQTYEQIIKTHPAQKAIITSGYAEDIEVRKVLDLGAGLYLKKPFIIDQLAEAIYTELSKNLSS